jgi:hypothetical protein
MSPAVTSSSSPRRKYQFLLEDANIRRWHENVSRGSEVTADVYLRRLGSFCLRNKTTPKAILTLTEVELYNLLLDLVSSMEAAGHAGSYTESVFKAIRSWLSHNGKDVRRKIKIRGAGDAPSLRDERVPTKEELKRIFLSGDKKARVASVLVAHSGVRIEVLGNYEGQDGLRVADLPELEIKHDNVSFGRKPALVIVRRELSKGGHQYFTFISSEGCEYVKDYLEDRLRSGETLTSKSSLITPKLRMKPFIKANNVSDSIKEAIKTAGFSWRPYVLRCYFDTMLMLAESKGLVLRDYRQFWMGHKGDIENRYTTNKLRLPESVVEDMRAAYSRSEEFLQTTQKVETSEERIRDSFSRQLLLVAGFSRDEVDKMDLLSLSDEDLQKKVRQKLLGANTDSNVKQKAVDISEVGKYLAQGVFEPPR